MHQRECCATKVWCFPRATNPVRSSVVDILADPVDHGPWVETLNFMDVGFLRRTTGHRLLCLSSMVSSPRCLLILTQRWDFIQVSCGGCLFYQLSVSRRKFRVGNGDTRTHGSSRGPCQPCLPQSALKVEGVIPSRCLTTISRHGRKEHAQTDRVQSCKRRNLFFPLPNGTQPCPSVAEGGRRHHQTTHACDIPMIGRRTCTSGRSLERPFRDQAARPCSRPVPSCRCPDVCCPVCLLSRRPQAEHHGK